MAERYDFYVHDNRKVTFNLTEPIMREDSGVTDFVFHIPKILNELEVSDWAWWFVFVNANKEKYSIALTLSDDPESPLEKNVATYTVDYSMSIKAGSVQFALEAINAGTGGAIDNEWHTQSYEIKVKETLQGNQAEYVETESDIISALIVEVQRKSAALFNEIQQKTNSLVGGATPLPVNLKSLMTDPQKVYLYTGSETGESTGYWYHWNGTDFVPGGQYASGIVIDSTLTQSGQAADAKVVGDKIEDLDNAFITTSNRHLNVYKKNNVTIGQYWDSEGNTKTSAAWATTDYMPIDSLYAYYKGITSFGTNPRAIFADENKRFIKSFKHKASSEYTRIQDSEIVPLNAKYVSFSISKQDVDTFEYAISVLDDCENAKTEIEAVNYALKLKPIIFTKGYYIAIGNSSNISEAVSNPTENSQWLYAIVECNKGDVFTIKCDGGTSPKAYCFTDASYNVLSKTSDINFEGEIVAPDNSSYLVLHRYYTNNSYSFFGKSVLNQIDEINALPALSNIALCGNNNMIWSWWIYPQVVSFSRVRNMIYWGFTTSDGYKGIAAYDIVAKTTKKNILAKNDVDDHNGLAVYVYEDGTILTAYSTGHDEDNYMHVRKSTARENIDLFASETLLESIGKTSYAQIIYSNGNTYLFYRTGTTNWAYRISGDNGDTWGDEVVLITSSVQYYCMFRPTTTDGVIRVLMYSNPQLGDSTDTNIRQAFLHTDNNMLYDSNNLTALGSSNVDKDDITILIGNTANLRRQRLLDTAITAPERPLILYAPYNDLNSFSDASYVLYDTGEKHDIVITGKPLVGSYFLGASFVKPEKIVVAHGSSASGGTDIMSIYTYNGSAVEVQKDIYSEERTSIPIRNGRPIADVNEKTLLWFRGEYKDASYTDFNTDAKMYLVANDTIVF